MKAIRTLLISLLLLASTAISYANLGNYNPDMPVGLSYQIYVGPLSAPLPETTRSLFGQVQEEASAAGYTYYAGQFSTYREASIFENTLRYDGYETAKIVAWFSKYPIPVEDGIAFENDLNYIDKAYIYGTEPTVSVDDLNALLELVKDPTAFYYTVQVGVYASLEHQTLQSDFENLEIRETDKGYYTLSTGQLGNMEEAVALRLSIVKMGYTDAFVTAYAHGDQLSIYEANNIENELGKIALVAR